LKGSGWLKKQGKRERTESREKTRNSFAINEKEEER